jgi:hypothetical protein
MAGDEADERMRRLSERYRERAAVLSGMLQWNDQKGAELRWMRIGALKMPEAVSEERKGAPNVHNVVR